MFNLFLTILIFILFYLNFIKIFKKIINLKEYNYIKSKNKFNININLKYTYYIILSILK